MKNQKYRLRNIVLILLCCILLVVLFPLVSANSELYKAILFASTGIVIVLLVFLIRVHIFTNEKIKE